MIDVLKRKREDRKLFLLPIAAQKSIGPVRGIGGAWKWLLNACKK